MVKSTAVEGEISYSMQNKTAWKTNRDFQSKSVFLLLLLSCGFYLLENFLIKIDNLVVILWTE